MTCRQCGVDKPETEFYRRHKSETRHSECKPCYNGASYRRKLGQVKMHSRAGDDGIVEQHIHRIWREEFSLGYA